MDNTINSIKEIVSEVNNKVKRVYWTNQEIDKYFGKRSVNGILKDGGTCFMNPCFDLTLVSSHLLSLENIPHEFVIEEHLPVNGFNFNRLHFVIEFQDINKYKNYFLNYKKANEVYILEGRYNGREDIPRAQMIKISGKKIDPKKPIYQDFGYNNLEDFLNDKFKGYSLKTNLDRLKKDNSIENYISYKQKFKDEFLIITTPQSQF